MRFIFDSSALLNIVRVLGADALGYLRGNYVLTLTFYEVGNALWKEATLLGRITAEEAATLLNLLSNTCRMLNIVAPKDPLKALKLACALKITCYDSAYVTVAYERNATLVTDDSVLREKILENEEVVAKVLGGKVNVISTDELVRKVKT